MVSPSEGSDAFRCGTPPTTQWQSVSHEQMQTSEREQGHMAASVWSSLVCSRAMVCACCRTTSCTPAACASVRRSLSDKSTLLAKNACEVSRQCCARFFTAKARQPVMFPLRDLLLLTLFEQLVHVGAGVHQMRDLRVVAYRSGRSRQALITQQPRFELGRVRLVAGNARHSQRLQPQITTIHQ